MAFWGIEVKPGKPVTHSFDRVRGRLRISQATLGFGSSTQKSLVQCNIGVKAPVLLCALLPEKTESCHMDVEFEETDDVVFSVLGPRSVYLTGYYVGNLRHSNLNDDTESYGEDIENTDKEESNHSRDEDTYEDSFIDDGDLEVFPSSPVSSDGVDEEVACNKNAKGSKGNHRRLKKKYQSVESDDDSSSQQQNIVNCSKRVPVRNGEENEDNEDFFLVSSLLRKRSDANNMMVGSTEKSEDAIERVNKKAEDGDNHVIKSKGKANVALAESKPEGKTDLEYNSSLPCDDICCEDGTEPRRKKKKLSEEGKSPAVDVVSNCNTIEEKSSQCETNANIMCEGVLLCGEQNQKPATDKKHNLSKDLFPSSNEMGPDNGTKAKKKRKARSKIKGLETDSCSHNYTNKGEKVLQAEADADVDEDLLMRDKDERKPVTAMLGCENVTKPRKSSEQCAMECNCTNIAEGSHAKKGDKKTSCMGRKLLTSNEQDQKLAGDKCKIEVDPNQLTSEFQYEKERKKKKKKKGKTQDSQKKVDMGVPFLSKEEQSKFVMEFHVDNANAKSSHVRTLSNGLIIEEIEKGETDGKIAAPGKKVKVHYVGRLKENGHLFDTNLDKPPLKFCLGDDDIIKGWNIGINGMHIGGRRRLIIPPSIGYGSQSAGENVPPDSWLVYDIKLVGIH